MSEELFEDIENLDDDDLQRVNRLIKKLAGRKGSKQNEDHTLSRSQRKRRKKVDNRDQDNIIEDGEGRKQPRDKIITPEEHRQNRQGRSQPRTERNQRNQINKGGRRNKGTSARVESFDTSGGRENRFLKMKERNSNKADVKIDQILSHGKKPTLRPDQYQPIEAQCRKCNLYFDIHPSQVFEDPDLGLIFTCNNCSGR